SWKADLLLTGSRGRRGISRVVLGSVSHSLLMAVGCSVRIVRGVKLARPYVQRVLVALDDSQYSKQVVSVITSRPWADGAQFRLVTSVPTLAQYMQEGQTQSQDVGPLKIARDDHLEAALASLESTSADVRDKVKNIEVDFKVIDGDPREAIVDEAERWGARLIITGCKGKNWIERLFVGSVSESIATWANCSVEVVKN
ncbi:MAG: universal stress protein, partial [Terriglobales bacterium]